LHPCDRVTGGSCPPPVPTERGVRFLLRCTFGVPHHALRQVVHSTFAAIRSRSVSMVSLILSLHRGLSLPLNGAHVAQERVTCRRPLPPVNGSPVLRVLSAGLTSARSLDRPCLGGLSGLAPEPDGSPLFPSSPSVTCQRYEPRKRPGPLAVSRYRDAAFPVEGSGRPLRSRSILLRCPAGRG